MNFGVYDIDTELYVPYRIVDHKIKLFLDRIPDNLEIHVFNFEDDTFVKYTPKEFFDLNKKSV